MGEPAQVAGGGCGAGCSVSEAPVFAGGSGARVRCLQRPSLQAAVVLDALCLQHLCLQALGTQALSAQGHEMLHHLSALCLPYNDSLGGSQNNIPPSFCPVPTHKVSLDTLTRHATKHAQCLV